MEQIREEIEHVAELLYQEKKDDAYEGIRGLVPVLMEYTDGIQDEDRQKRLAGILGSALEAMEQEDLTLLADILQYDLVEELE